MDFLVLGLNHKSAPLEIREKVSFFPYKILEALQYLQSYPYIEECLILSTCNRVELYALATSDIEGFNSLKNFLSDYHNLNESIDKYLYFYQNQEALRHVFRVVSSLDSMIVGENQILYQVKQAYLNACKASVAGKLISFVFQEALWVGRKIRIETDIGKGVVSISSAAIELAKKTLKSLEAKKILIIGAGKIGELIAKNLADRGIKLILVANRTYEKAVSLAEIFKGKAVRFEQLPSALSEVDIVISSTAAPHYILKKKDIVSIIEKRNGSPLFFIDLGVPRNIEQSLAEIKKVYLYNVDDLKKISETNLSERLNEAYKAEEIVKEESKRMYAKIADIFSSELVVV